MWRQLRQRGGDVGQIGGILHPHGTSSIADRASGEHAIGMNRETVRGKGARQKGVKKPKEVKRVKGAKKPVGPQEATPNTTGTL
ncbi:MAG: hypothetical protein D3908_13095 [Candidatus Electrothrix sp. AUS4]|nr:hypothetical protein [Candidatus Electrothrix sp. AUS4]